MKPKFLIQSAFRALRAHKARSFLTILGILIGVMSIIAMMSIGQGASRLVLAEYEQLGAEMVFAVPGQIETGFMDFFFVDLFTNRDLEALERPANVPHLKDIMPLVIVPNRVSYRGEVYRGAMTTGGKAEFFTEAFGLDLEEGEIFTELDVQSRARVAIVGTNLKNELFEQERVVGENFMIGDSRFQVVGVYAPAGQIGPVNLDDFIIIPYTTAQTYILGSDKIEEFYIRADDPANVDRLAFDVTATLRETRNIYPGEEDDFTVMTQEGVLDMIADVMRILNVFLISVVSIALLVGGIGIMNIMLVSVTERTKEIGLRKALGATRNDILKQFLWEAVILTVLGGLIGIILGAGISWVVSMILSELYMLNWPFIFPLQAVVLGLTMSIVVGLIFGLYPAKQAADKDPIEALKYEK